MRPFKTALLTAAALLGMWTAARADTYTVEVFTGDIGHGFDAVIGSSSLFTNANHSQVAQFTYAGPLSFMNNASQNANAAGDLNSTFFGANAAGISNYSPVTALSGKATPDYGSFATLSSFLAASGSVGGYGYDSLYLIYDNTPLAPGTRLAITHDDGVGVYENNTLLAGTTTGPTAAITETVTLPTAGNVGYAYGRENGTPSILNVAVPEPVSMAILGVGLAGIGFARGRR